MSELVLELLIEEMPADAQLAGENQLKSLLARAIKADGIEDAEPNAYSTPRRMIIVCDQLPTHTPSITIERRGPRVDAPQKAIDGFLSASGFRDISQCRQEETPKGTFLFADIHQAGKSCHDRAPIWIGEMLKSMSWPKTMRFGDDKFVWIRPLRAIACVFDGKPVDGTIAVNNATFPLRDHTIGHRYQPKEITIKSADQLLEDLRKNHVLPTRFERHQAMLAQFAAIEDTHNITIIPDEDLQQEVIGLVETVDCLVGDIDAQFLDLPPQVLISAMRNHQKYFTTRDANDNIAPHYVFVSNMPKQAKARKNIVHGNNRVLRARLADAQFFWDIDCKTPIANMADGLANIRFFESLGDLAQKTLRVQSLGAFIINDLIPDARLNGAHFAKAAQYCKVDLCSQIVGEFPDLQGVMGGLLVEHAKYDPSIGEAIGHHYAPQSATDTAPTGIGGVLALSDKIDTLTGFFLIDKAPSGSKDPFALRRAATGVVRIICEQLPIDALMPIIDRAIDLYRDQQLPGIPAHSSAQGDILAFIIDRVKVSLRDQDVRHDHINAALGSKVFGHDLRAISAIAKELATFVSQPTNLPLLQAAKRIHNILQKADIKTLPAIDKTLFQHPSEQALWDSFDSTAQKFQDYCQQKNFPKALDSLLESQGQIDGYFDAVMVNDENPDIRQNRLATLFELHLLFTNLADFSKLEL